MGLCPFLFSKSPNTNLKKQHKHDLNMNTTTKSISFYLNTILVFLFSYNFNAQSQVPIYGNETWSTTANLPPGFDDGIIVKQNATLTINNSIILLMKPDKTILVEKGGKLVLTNVTIDVNADSKTNSWGGIIIEGDGTQSQYNGTQFNPIQGVVEMTNSILRNANCSIFVGNATQSGKNGGIARCMNSSFINCITGVQVQPYEDADPVNKENNACYFENNTFRWIEGINRNKLNQQQISCSNTTLTLRTFGAQMVFNSIQGIKVRGNKFYNYITYAYWLSDIIQLSNQNCKSAALTYEYSMRGNGVTVNNSSVNFYKSGPCCTGLNNANTSSCVPCLGEGNYFEGFQIGISVTDIPSNTAARYTDIIGNTFKDNSIGIYSKLSNPGNVLNILNNSISVDESMMLNWYCSKFIVNLTGIYLYKANNPVVSGNVISIDFNLDVYHDPNASCQGLSNDYDHNTNYESGIYLRDCYGTITVLANNITVAKYSDGCEPIGGYAGMVIANSGDLLSNQMLDVNNNLFKLKQSVTSTNKYDILFLSLEADGNRNHIQTTLSGSLSQGLKNTFSKQNSDFGYTQFNLGFYNPYSKRNWASNPDPFSKIQYYYYNYSLYKPAFVDGNWGSDVSIDPSSGTLQATTYDCGHFPQLVVDENLCSSYPGNGNIDYGCFGTQNYCLKVYPNPAVQNIVIDLFNPNGPNAQDNLTIKYKQTGQQIYSEFKKSTNGGLTLDLKALAISYNTPIPGIYTIQYGTESRDVYLQ